MPLFGGAVEPDRYVYHYTTREAALGAILAQGQLRLGLLTWTNDPRESQQWLVDLTKSAPGPFPMDEFFPTIRKADRLIKATTKVACFSRDDPEGMARPPNEHFARGWAHSRMWSQYAGGHSGVCLIFARAALSEAMAGLEEHGTLWSGPVLYRNRPHLELDASNLSYDAIAERGLEGVVEDHVHRHWEGLFFVKNQDWASEWEYRWVLRSPELRPAFVDVAGTLAGIVVGHSFPATDAAILRHYAEEFGIVETLGRCNWKNGFPSVLPGFDAPVPRI